jgi:DNA end-binding protein Ku
MAPRASWKGYLKLSLVSCPVRLYPATSSQDRVRFNQLHKETHNRINMKPVDPELGLVERADLVKGYEYEDKKYVIIDDSDLEAVKLETNHTLAIEAFVEGEEVDSIWQDTPYYLAPDGAMAEETFIVLREAMREAGKVAIARLVLSSRERMVTIAPREKGMYVCTLRAPNEVRATGTYFGDIPDGKPDPEMLELATALIKQKSTEFDPKAYEDRYEAALMAMIKEKLKGHKPIIAAEPARGNVVNLMDALKQSLGQSKPPAASRSKKPVAAAAEEEPAAPTATATGGRRRAPAKSKAS